MKALMGATSEIETLRLLDEIRALRGRVAELEAALEQAEEEAEEQAATTVDVRGELVEAGTTT